MTEAKDTPAAPSESDPDASWRESLPKALQPVALFHGRALFEFTLSICQFNEDAKAFANLVKSADARERIMRMCQVVNRITEIGRVKANWTGEDIIGCKNAIDIALRETIVPAGSAILLPQGTRH